MRKGLRQVDLARMAGVSETTGPVIIPSRGTVLDRRRRRDVPDGRVLNSREHRGAYSRGDKRPGGRRELCPAGWLHARRIGQRGRARSLGSSATAASTRASSAQSCRSPARSGRRARRGSRRSCCRSFYPVLWAGRHWKDLPPSTICSGRGFAGFS